MNKKIITVVIVICAVAVYSKISFSESPAPELQSQIADVNAENDSPNTDVNDPTQSLIADLRAEVDLLKADVNDLQTQFIEFQTNPSLQKKTAKELYEEKRQKNLERAQSLKQLKAEQELQAHKEALRDAELENIRSKKRPAKTVNTSTQSETPRQHSTKIYRETAK